MTGRTCPLCGAADAAGFCRDRVREYLRCGVCGLVFVPPEYFVSLKDEEARYRLHRNSPSDAGYRRYLNRVFAPMNERLAPRSHGLDFGSGPGPTLSVLFEDAGHAVDLYDPFFAGDSSVWTKRYDFITATEVVEHLREPGKELDRLWSLLKPGGILGVMTQTVPDSIPFMKWSYRDDITHIAFFSRATFEWLADRLKAEIVFQEKDVFLFQ